MNGLTGHVKSITFHTKWFFMSPQESSACLWIRTKNRNLNAQFALDHRSYHLDFVAIGFTFQLHRRSDSLDFTCHRDYLLDYLAGAASKS
jgi:hypothetical protein